MSLKSSLILLIVAFTFISCKKSSTDPKSSQKEIISFITRTTPNVAGVIDTVKNTVTVSLPIGTNLTNIAPTIEVSPLATISPASGVAQDFSKPILYTITSEDGSQRVITAIGQFAPDPANFIMYDNEKYPLMDGTQYFRGSPFYNQNLRLSDNQNRGKENIIVFLSWYNPDGEIKPGKFTFFSGSTTINNPYVNGVISNRLQNGEWSINTGGNAQIEILNGVYRVTFNGTLHNGAVVKGSYFGPLLKSEK